MCSHKITHIYTWIFPECILLRLNCVALQCTGASDYSPNVNVTLVLSHDELIFFGRILYQSWVAAVVFVLIYTCCDVATAIVVVVSRKNFHAFRSNAPNA